MRHTRNRQMTKIGEENFMRMKNIKISTIRKPDGKFPNRLDPTFRWHRDYHGMNIVSFNRNGETFITYVIKGRN
ncbi:hypothetical protein OCD85_01080 [Bacillus pacificus]|uniref:hypothetical protein n=1 Tax=Bacillus cereus group TaxID=86661 RepID=UPI000936813F|nr:MULTISPECIES: hypothetical protein [Bacillus cereus group]MCC2352014.1 hypothetical protein [Bacillus pacificus]MCU5359639.1 hypothetical protein [Bacillus pacificus]MCU5467463.1 hypothetical protein [Bacillus pacificus]MDA1958538.1 hypothetical protein [Bacillus cereus group sp. BcHK10]MDA2758634.1 hypothetical protein [Bacillus cereus group sp. Bc007]